MCELHEAARQGTTCVGLVFAIIGEKNAEVVNDPSLRTYKAPCVFASKNMQTLNGQSALDLYQEASQTPAAMHTLLAA